jgi:hypothetical protein
MRLISHQSHLFTGNFLCSGDSLAESSTKSEKVKGLEILSQFLFFYSISTHKFVLYLDIVFVFDAIAKNDR